MDTAYMLASWQYSFHMIAVRIINLRLRFQQQSVFTSNMKLRLAHETRANVIGVMIILHTNERHYILVHNPRYILEHNSRAYRFKVQIERFESNSVTINHKGCTKKRFVHEQYGYIYLDIKAIRSINLLSPSYVFATGRHTSACASTGPSRLGVYVER